MKKIIFLIINVLVAATLSAQTMVFNVIEVKAKEYSANEMEEAYETCCTDMKPNKGGFARQANGKGAEKGMTHRRRGRALIHI